MDTSLLYFGEKVVVVQFFILYLNMNKYLTDFLYAWFSSFGLWCTIILVNVGSGMIAI